MDPVGHGRDKMAKEFGGNPGGRFLMQLDKAEFRRSIDGDKEMELAFFGPHFGNVDVQEADRIGFELLLRRLACALAAERRPAAFDLVRCFHFDSIGVPRLEIMQRDYGDPEAWQASATAD